MADRPLLFRVFRRVRSRPTGTSAASVDWIRRKIRGTVQVSLSGSCASELPRVSSRQHYKSYLCRFCVLSIHSEYGRGNYISHYPTLVVSPFMLAPKSVDIIEEHGHLELHIKPAFTCLICQTSQTIVQKKVGNWNKLDFNWLKLFWRFRCHCSPTDENWLPMTGQVIQNGSRG